ncbi:hypothetical protein DM02DRAFT_613393 [Periconia macrospinosa]|uniref:2EXR domain-containing protein n=1 Tax=Periconia macrospinosa TaxID=97972 RepID=A0A2V1DUV0_9PLEO|nr:hypothetical protein DM02DRAFT_613393 [Periconia macrospinosa]
MINISNLLDRSFQPAAWQPPLPHREGLLTALLYATARRYNTLLQEVTPHSAPPFPFLRLPRELRDEIYVYALCAPAYIEVESPQALTRPCQDLLTNIHKPPTPGLLYVNKQVHAEAVESLYGSNTFRFQKPDAMRAFEARVGRANCTRVRRIGICVLFPDNYVDDAKAGEWPSRGTAFGYHKTMGLVLWNSAPATWCMALKSSRFEQLTWFGVEGDRMWRWARLGKSRIPLFLRDCIVELLGRSGRLPRIDLMGIRDQDRNLFPEEWDVVMEHWVVYKQEAERLRITVENSRSA